MYIFILLLIFLLHLNALMYFLDVVQGVRPTGFLKNYPSVPNSTWAWEDDATVGVWSLAYDWLILIHIVI